MLAPRVVRLSQVASVHPLFNGERPITRGSLARSNGTDLVRELCLGRAEGLTSMTKWAPSEGVCLLRRSISQESRSAIRSRLSVSIPKEAEPILIVPVFA